MEGTPKEKELNLLTDFVFYIINGLLLFAFSYPLFLLLIMPIQIAFYFSIFLFLNPLIAILALALTSFIIGVVNVITARFLWSYRCKKNGKVLMTHGLLIVIMTELFLLPFPQAYAILSSTRLWIAPIFLALFCADYMILFGLIGKVVARRYIEQPSSKHRVNRGYRHGVIRDEKSLSFVGTRARCPRCQASHKYHDEDIDENGIVICPSCNRPFYVESISILMNKIGENEDTNSRIDL